MPLPEEGKQFPPTEWDAPFARYAMNSAWMSDDLDPVAALLGGLAGSRGDNPATHYHKGDATWRSGGVRGRLNSWFNGRIVQATTPTPGAGSHEHETRLHLPAAGDIAAMSAAALMQSPPTVRLASGGKPLNDRRSEAMDRMFQNDEQRLELYNAAELVAGLSAVALTAHWDPDVSDHPWMQHTACDAVIPEWRGRFLSAVNLWTTYPITLGAITETVLYHVERHEPGQVIHAIYKGEALSIGRRIPLDSDIVPEGLRHLPGIRGATIGADFTVTLPSGVPELTATWWRNRPTKRLRGMGQFERLGRADIEGAEPILDALDMNSSSWMRDVKVGRAQMIVPKSMTESLGEGRGNGFNADAEYLVPLEFTTLNAGDGDRSILVNQFAIRHEAHAATHLHLFRQLVEHAGWTVAGAGYRSSESGGAAVTAREVSATENRSAATLDVKQLEFKRAMSRLAPAMIALNHRHYAGPEQGDAEVVIEFEDTSDVDPLIQAQIAQAQYNARAASVRTLVAGLHPDWDETQIDRERDVIYLENGIGPEANPDDQFDRDGNRIPTEPDPDEPSAAPDPDEEETP